MITWGGLRGTVAAPWCGLEAPEGSGIPFVEENKPKHSKYSCKRFILTVIKTMSANFYI
jgi:hypothetical protein